MVLLLLLLWQSSCCKIANVSLCCCCCCWLEALAVCLHSCSFPFLPLGAAMMSVLNVIIVHSNGTVFAVATVILTVVAQVIAAAICNVAVGSSNIISAIVDVAAVIIDATIGCRRCLVGGIVIVILGTCGSIECLYMILDDFARKLTMLPGLLSHFQRVKCD